MRIVAAARLHRPAARRAAGRFLVEGVKPVIDALEAGAVLELYGTPDTLHGRQELRAATLDAGVTPMTVTAKAAASLSDTVTPQGVVAVCRTVDVPINEALAGQPRLVAVLVDVADPGNAGTVIRVADAAGADAVVLAGTSVDPHNGKCVRSCAGSLFHLPVVRTPSTEDLPDTLRSAGLHLLATAADGEIDLYDADRALEGPTAWLFGNEAHGLEPRLASAADHRVRVPIHGRAESLNLAAAAAVCMYASARAHRRP